MINEFGLAEEKYKKIKDEKFLSDKDTLSVIGEVRTMFQSLHEGATGGGYLTLGIEQLLNFEFDLSRYSEFLGTKQSEADGKYTYFRDKQKQLFLKNFLENKRTILLNKEKVTQTEIEAETTIQMEDFQDKVNVLYEYSKYLKEFNDSIGRFLLAITHRIKNLQGEESLKQR